VNRGDGFTIAASEAREIAQIARRTVISDDALSVLVPDSEEIVGFGPGQIRATVRAPGLVIQEWDRVRTDWLTIRTGARWCWGSAPWRRRDGRLGGLLATRCSCVVLREAADGAAPRSGVAACL